MKHLARVAMIANVCANMSASEKSERTDQVGAKQMSSGVGYRRRAATHPANHTSTPLEHMRAPRSSTTSALATPGPGTREALFNRRVEKERRGREENYWRAGIEEKYYDFQAT